MLTAKRVRAISKATDLRVQQERAERPGYFRLASTPLEIQVGKPCGCEACERDGAHEPACAVHEEPAAACDCARSAT